MRKNIVRARAHELLSHLVPIQAMKSDLERELYIAVKKGLEAFAEPRRKKRRKKSASAQGKRLV